MTKPLPDCCDCAHADLADDRNPRYPCTIGFKPRFYQIFIHGGGYSYGRWVKICGRFERREEE